MSEFEFVVFLRLRKKRTTPSESSKPATHVAPVGKRPSSWTTRQLLQVPSPDANLRKATIRFH